MNAPVSYKSSLPVRVFVRPLGMRLAVIVGSVIHLLRRRDAFTLLL